MSYLLPHQNSKNKARSSTKLKINCKERVGSATVDWLELTRMFDHTSSDFKIYTGLLDKRMHIVAKIGLSKLDEEYSVGQQLDALGLPTFMSFHCIFKCMDKFSKLAKITKTICGESGDNITVLLMPYLSEGRIDEWKWDRGNFAVMKNVIKHVCLTLLYSYMKLNFLHMDLHLGNVLLRKTTRGMLTYGDYGDCEVLGLIPVIMDFEKSRFAAAEQQEQQRQVYMDIDNFIGLMSNSCNVKFNCAAVKDALKKLILNNTAITTVICKDICVGVDKIEITYIVSELKPMPDCLKPA
jgi:hypothetical protein